MQDVGTLLFLDSAASCGSWESTDDDSYDGALSSLLAEPAAAEQARRGRPLPSTVQARQGARRVEAAKLPV